MTALPTMALQSSQLTQRRRAGASSQRADRARGSGSTHCSPAMMRIRERVAATDAIATSQSMPMSHPTVSSNSRHSPSLTIRPSRGCHCRGPEPSAGPNASIAGFHRFCHARDGETVNVTTSSTHPLGGKEATSPSWSLISCFHSAFDGERLVLTLACPQSRINPSSTPIGAPTARVDTDPVSFEAHAAATRFHPSASPTGMRKLSRSPADSRSPDPSPHRRSKEISLVVSGGGNRRAISAR